ncbi:dTDP-4-amino-4,6-dideoxygalactose transaminase [Photobacterium kishitanii]|uniref:dTDP-4-amino-4,6-dideoxygalactose transaminase n=1 Tax=Photobacterium kishitanii TaxID=318456 RepID=UPI000D17143B|nr:dTDP-4-amino-4,6-dideoxygalactose transaminase [Photobacterium kishitanii]PSW60623.1 dTDP-4-amino-4,6-dideoxygalactose transaminase [Photobacterium kishitanii]
MIQFNKPTLVGSEIDNLKKAISSNELCGDRSYSHKCQKWIENNFKCKKALMTPNCTQALEMAAILIDLKPGDEVIVPSYTFVSSANAFVLRGAKIVFVDIKPDTMNIDENKIEEAITPKTKAIVPVHYAGIACEMDEIMRIADKYNLYVIEDAAQAVMSSYKGKALGTIGHLSAYSFHETKNYTSGGEGGALLLNDEKLISRAEIIREKGTNRSQFIDGIVDKYTWIDIGSSFLPGELQSAYLYSQLLDAEKINNKRLELWNLYYESLSDYEYSDKFELPVITDGCQHNAHMFYIKLKDNQVRSSFIKYMKENNVLTVFHYIPLHSSPAGLKFGYFYGEDVFTTKDSMRLVRLPLYYNLSISDVNKVISLVRSFFDECS